MRNISVFKKSVIYSVTGAIIRYIGRRISHYTSNWCMWNSQYL